VLGFHQGQFPGIDEADVTVGETRVLSDAGIAADFIAHASSTPSSTMWFPTVVALKQANVVTGEIAATRFTSPTTEDAILESYAQGRSGFSAGCGSSCQTNGGPDVAVCAQYCGCMFAFVIGQDASKLSSGDDAAHQQLTDAAGACMKDALTAPAK
jgi:hypothetical protein